jgi:penicillin-binding protein 1A
MEKKSPQHPFPWKRIFLGTAIALTAVLLLFLGVIRHLIRTAPDIDSITVSPTESATYICDENGTYLRKLTLASSNRDIVTLDEIPDTLQKAVIAIEDERFYEHGGIDVRGILRAFWSGVTSGSFSEGASTITQQLIKNNVFTEWTQENSFADRFSRKVQEQYLALQLEDRISKDEILEDYLNTINLGAGCYGVQAAARRYFGKDVSDLSLSESAVLAAIPQNPTGYNPITNAEANRKRQKIVLEYMKEQNYISEEELQAALADDVYSRIQTYNENYEDETVYSYYEDALIDQVMEVLTTEKGYTSEQAYRAVYSGGLRIFSAQDQNIQTICDEEFQNSANFPAGTQYGVDYALSVADETGLVTHYGSDALRSYIRQTVNPDFDLMCDSGEEAQLYAELFRESILEDAADENEPADSAEAQQTDPSDASALSEDTSALSENTSALSEDTSANTRLTVIGERLTLSPQPQASVVVIDQQTGLVRAIVGGRGEKTASLTLNRATDTLRQPGSTFKILTAYAPALDSFGQTLATTYENEPYTYENGTPVSNWDITDYSGTVTVREAITRSINVIAVKCITEISPKSGFDYAKRFGISTLYEAYESDGTIVSDIIQPLALGGITQGVSNLELCGAYAAIANEGQYLEPLFFTKILDRHGDVIVDYTADGSSGGTSENTLQHSSSASNESTSQGFSSVSNESTEQGRISRQVISPETAFLLTDAMQDVVSSPRGTAYGSISAAGQPVAGKTGTTSNYKDIWFAGYTPYYTCCVWGGYDNNQDLPDTSTSHTYNKVLWSAIMNRIHYSLPAASFSVPETIRSVTLCSESHLIAVPDGCPETYAEYFATGTEPDQECTLHEPQPETELSTEPILIYPDIFETEETETESETDDDTEMDSEITETETDSETASDATDTENDSERSETEANPGTLPDTDAGVSENSLLGSETLPQAAEDASDSGSEALQTETNSLDDLIHRLGGLGRIP